MRVAFITGWFLFKNNGSGASLFIQQLRDGLQKKGIIVDLITPQFTSIKSYHMAMLGRILKNFFLIRNSIKKYDLVVCFDYDGFALRKSNVPIICCPRGILKEVAKTEHGIYRFFLKLQGFFEKINLERADYIIVPSKYAQMSVKKYYGIDDNKLTIISNGIDNYWKNTFVTSNINKKIKILAVGKMYPRKNFPLLLKAFDLVYRKHLEIQLHIVGDGIEFKLIKNLKNKLYSKNGIIIYGFVSNREVLKNIYIECDIVCHLSEQETFGNVFLEAMALGKPVIALRMASAPEIVQNGYNGILVDTKNPIKIAEKIEMLITQPKKIKIMGNNAVKTANFFSQEKTIDNYHNKFLEIINE